MTFGPPYVRLARDDCVQLLTCRSLSVDGVTPLPNPRLVSTSLHRENGTSPVVDLRYSLMLMQWGQFLDHDITSTPMSRDAGGGILNCSECQSHSKDKECLPIQIPSDDQYFKRQKCLPFVRYLHREHLFVSGWFHNM